MNDENELVTMIILGILIGAFLLFLILGLTETFNPVERLNIDKDKLVSDYVKLNYPEFENCSIKYKTSSEIACDYEIYGAEVYCNERLQPRDSLSIMGSNPDNIVCFTDGLNIKKILKLRLREEGLVNE